MTTAQNGAAEVLALRSVLALRRRGIAAASAVRLAASALPSLLPIADALERGAVPSPKTLTERALARAEALAPDDLALLVDDVAGAAAIRDAERRSERPLVALLVGGGVLGCLAGWATVSSYDFFPSELMPDIVRRALAVVLIMRFAGLPVAALALVAHRRGLLRKRLPGERTFAVIAALRMGAPLESLPLDDRERAFAMRARARKGEVAAARALASAMEDEGLPRALRQRRALIITATVAFIAVVVLVMSTFAAPLFAIARVVE